MLLRSYAKVRVEWGDFRVRLHERLVEWAGSERGGVAAEYGLLVALIAVVIVVGASLLGIAINARLTTTATCVDTAPTAC